VAVDMAGCGDYVVPGISRLPPQWSKCRWQFTTTSITVGS
jgi:hypothetical protein